MQSENNNLAFCYPKYWLLYTMPIIRYREGIFSYRGNQFLSTVSVSTSARLVFCKVLLCIYYHYGLRILNAYFLLYTNY